MQLQMIVEEKDQGHVSGGGICDRVRKKGMCKPICQRQESSDNFAFDGI